MQSTVITNNGGVTVTQSGNGQGTVYPATAGVHVVSTTTGPYPQQPQYPKQQQGQPQYGQQQQGHQQVILVQAPQTYRPMRSGPTIYQQYPGKASQILGGIQIGLGCFLILFNIIGIVIESENASSGTSIWTGVFFIITGSFGIPAGRTKLQCHIVCFMVMSIIAAVLAVPVLITYAVGAACDSSDGCYTYYWNYKDRDQKEARVAMGALMALLGGTEMIVAIVSSGLCCSGMCCYGGSTRGAVVGEASNVHYVTTQNTAVPQAGYTTNQGYPQPSTTNYQPQATGYQPPQPPTYSGDAPPPPYNADAPPSEQLYKY